MTNDYYLFCVILENCPYSIAAHELISSYKNIKKEFTFIKRNDMENYKTELISTFPQIYLKKYNTNGTQLIGGYDEFTKIINLFYKKIDKQNIDDYLQLNNLWNKKSLLRLIQLINS